MDKERKARLKMWTTARVHLAKANVLIEKAAEEAKFAWRSLYWSKVADHGMAQRIHWALCDITNATASLGQMHQQAKRKSMLLKKGGERGKERQG